MAEKCYAVMRAYFAVVCVVFLCEAHICVRAALPAGLSVDHGPVNGAIIERNGRQLAVYGNLSAKRSRIDTVLLTEARRDVTWAARGLTPKHILAELEKRHKE